MHAQPGQTLHTVLTSLVSSCRWSGSPKQETALERKHFSNYSDSTKEKWWKIRKSPQIAPLENKCRWNEYIWGILAQSAILPKFKITGVFTHQQRARKRKQNNLKINSSTFFKFKSHGLKGRQANTFLVSNLSREYGMLGLKEKIRKKNSTVGPTRGELQQKAGSKRRRKLVQERAHRTTELLDFVPLMPGHILSAEWKNQCFSKYKQCIW